MSRCAPPPSSLHPPRVSAVRIFSGRLNLNACQSSLLIIVWQAFRYFVITRMSKMSVAKDKLQEWIAEELKKVLELDSAEDLSR